MSTKDDNEDHVSGLEEDSAFDDLKVVRNQIGPRLRQILIKWSNLAISIVTLVTLLLVVTMPARELKISEVVPYGFTFSSISLAACISGLVLSLALPGEKRIKNWSKMAGFTEGKSLLSDLIFSFFWAGASQFLLIIVCISATVFGGGLLIASPSPLPFSHVFFLGLSIFLFYYALSQLWIVLQTLVQVGVLVILEERLN